MQVAKRARLGDLEVEATWQVKDYCLILQFSGLLNASQLELLNRYKTHTGAINLKLPDSNEVSVTITGYDLAHRTFFLALPEPRL